VLTSTVDGVVQRRTVGLEEGVRHDYSYCQYMASKAAGQQKTTDELISANQKYCHAVTSVTSGLLLWTPPLQRVSISPT
jgi:hypothetical protein